MKHVKATGLSSVFQGLNPVTFTEDAIKKGVTNNSIIYIKCVEGDNGIYGEQFVPGSTWIWAQGEWFANYTKPITSTEIEEIVLGEEVGNDWESNLTIVAHKLRAIKSIELTKEEGEQTGNFTIDPNVFYTIYDLNYNTTITAGPIYHDSIVNMYIMRLYIKSYTNDAGETVLPSLTLLGFNDRKGNPLKWYTGQSPTWTNGKVYEITIVDGIALWTEF